MNLVILRAASVAALLASAATAHAADAVVFEPVPEGPFAAAFNWTGAYIGLQAGYGWGDSRLVGVISGDFSVPDPDGILAGVYAGYNHQFSSSFVLGADFDFAWNNADGISPAFNAGGAAFPFPVNSVAAEINWSGAARARVGYAMDRFLPYVAGGVAFANMDSVLTVGAVPLPAYRDTYVGWTIGAGVEYAFTDALVGRFEYRYSDFGSQTFPATGAVEPLNVDLKTHDLRIGIAFKF